jgi:hypothetical protein
MPLSVRLGYARQQPFLSKKPIKTVLFSSVWIHLSVHRPALQPAALPQIGQRSGALDEKSGMARKNLRLFNVGNWRKGLFKGLDHPIVNSGGFPYVLPN